jgi:hypothetical protein
VSPPPRRLARVAGARRRGGALAASLLLLSLLLPLAAAPAAAAEARVALRPERLAMGEVAELSFELSGLDLQGERFTPRFELENLRVVGGPNRRDAVTWINGRLSRSYGLAWFVTPERPGRARAHDIRITVGERELALPERVAWVDERPAEGEAEMPLPPGNDPLTRMLRDLLPRSRWPGRPAGEPQVLLRAELSHDRPWPGQQMLYTLYLLVERRREGEGRVSVETIFPRRVPQFQGFWSQEIPLPESGRAEVVELDGRLWWRQPILQRALFPFEPGERKIDSAEADLRLVYFRPISFGLAEEPVRPAAIRRASNSPVVDVRDLPAAPPGFTGAVGRFRARSELRPARVAAGEAAVLTVELAGSGNVSGLPDPSLPRLPGLDPSAAQESTRHLIEKGRVESSRTWTWTLVPRAAGEWTVPAFSWLTFDPASADFRTVATAPLTLAASPAPPAPAPAPEPAPAPPPRPRWRGDLPAVAAGACAAVAVVTAFLLWRRLRRRNRPARRRLLARLRAAFGEPQARHAAGAAEQAWRDFLGESYALPAEAPVAQWPGLLAARGLEPTLGSDLLRLIDDLHYLRYAPQLASTDSLQQELLERSRRLARRLA